MDNDNDPLISHVQENTDDAERQFFDLDELAENLGGFGRHQKLSYILCCLINLSSGVITFVITFTSAAPKYRCWVDGCDSPNSTAVYDEPWLHVAIPFKEKDGNMVPDSCLQYVFNETDTCDEAFRENKTKACSKWVFDKEVYNVTAVSEFVLTCDKQWMSDLGATLFMAGMFIGALFWGLISDKWGRRKCLLISGFLTVISSICLSFSPNVTAFVIAMFFLAFCIIAAFQTCFVLGMELMGRNYRTRCGISLSIPFALGETVVGGMAYGVRHWRILQLLATVPFIFASILSFIVIPESLRWLMVRGKWEEARGKVLSISKFNKIHLREHQLPNSNSTIQKIDAEHMESESSIGNAIRKPVIFRMTLNLCFDWFVVSLLYYGISLNTRNMPGNVYLNFGLLSLSEMAAYVLCLLVLDKAGRRFMIASSFLLTGSTCTAVGFIPSDLQWLSIALSVLGKLGVSVAFCSIYVYSAELYPTFMRNTLIGIVAMFGKVGSTLSPIIASLGSTHQSIPFIIFGAFAGVSGFLVLDLPETTKRKLPETIADSEDLFRLSGGCGRWLSFAADEREDDEEAVIS